MADPHKTPGPSFNAKSPKWAHRLDSITGGRPDDETLTHQNQNQARRMLAS